MHTAHALTDSQVAARRHLTILGATGSVGKSTLEIVALHPEQFAVFALTAHSNIDRLFEQCLRFEPVFAAVSDASLAAVLQTRLHLAGSKTHVLSGEAGFIEVAEHIACDTVVAAIVGAAGLAPTLAAARSGKRIVLANKEALVMAGALFMETVRTHHATLLPIDSEHNAIYQCLDHTHYFHPGIEKITLTASGGPFRTTPLALLEAVTPEQACAHPQWVMGRKISVDSATMMNKGLEVIEAHWLFGVPIERIEALIHPQSVIHAMVTYIDGSILAQMGRPDMRTPIAQALAYPQRVVSGVAPLDLVTLSGLHFEPVNLEQFPCLALAWQALRQGGSASTTLNAANEIAVAAFLDKKIPFTAIFSIVCDVLESAIPQAVDTLEAILEVDQHARVCARERIAQRSAVF
jgi:1-deoxy-D-xylulose-5-phosphate reductoisomerase